MNRPDEMAAKPEMSADRPDQRRDMATLVVAQLLFLEAENPKKEICGQCVERLIRKPCHEDQFRTVLHGVTLLGVKRSKIRLGHRCPLRIINHTSKHAFLSVTAGNDPRGPQPERNAKGPQQTTPVIWDYRGFLGVGARSTEYLISRALLTEPPKARLDRRLIAEYVGLLRKTHQDISIATSLHHLRLALKLICPKEDWSWLLTITKRIAAAAPRKAKRCGLVSSDQLYLLGLELMDSAVAEAAKQDEISKATAMKYRDGMQITLLSLVVPRRRTAAALRIGKQLIRNGDLWALEIPPEDVKGKRALDFTLSAHLSRRIDLYLHKFRPRIPGAERHAGLWPSNKGRPKSRDAIYQAVCKRTETAFGYRVNPHRFRHAAGTLWSVEDPENVRGVKDLLGHASFEKTTETHYIMSQSRIALWQGQSNPQLNRVNRSHCIHRSRLDQVCYAADGGL